MCANFALFQLFAHLEPCKCRRTVQALHSCFLHDVRSKKPMCARLFRSPPALHRDKKRPPACSTRAALLGSGLLFLLLFLLLAQLPDALFLALDVGPRPAKTFIGLAPAGERIERERKAEHIQQQIQQHHRRRTLHLLTQIKMQLVKYPISVWELQQRH